MRVAVVGASGYAGGELLRLVSGHPSLELAMATADSSAGKTVADLHANLAGHPALANLTFEPHSAVKEADADLVFLALPSGQSAPVAAGLDDDIAVVDLGPDFRLADPADWTRHYGGDHPGRWVTGLPELPEARPLIRGARRVAAPGCYATAAIVALAPLVAAGLVAADDVVVVAASGTSGAGRSLRADLLGSEVMGSVSAYQAGGAHRHTPEIEQALAEMAGGRPARVSFTPMLAPMPRGILATCTARLVSATADTAATDTAALRAALAGAYAGEPFVAVLPDGRWPGTAAVAGSNGVHVQAAADPRTGRATVVAAIDNLGKGAAGQAIQNANLMLGLPETAGLTSIGVAP
ncbi:MAG TPA: N-acetyl-gamma-glutamyl-phosphate reductase [Streptosporangiaceae bacterium]|nr:N-acetyl-gamma-glutamyl-phosphate reductase [Streptosporangiaceae bacterium]